MLSHRLVRALLEHYAKLAGYSGDFSLTLSRTRFEAERDRRKEAVVVNEKGDYAITLDGEDPYVWINPILNTSTARLCRTAAHEAIHIALPDLPHGRAFRSKEAALLRLERL